MFRRILPPVLLASALFAAQRPVLLTTDCGADMDDQWAIAHLALTPGFEFRAVVTTHTGKYPNLPPPAAESSARCTRDVLAHMPGGAKPPVIPGSSVALSSRAPLRNAGVERILQESKGFTRDRRLTVLVIGAATDTASALLADPGLADRIEIVAMGFKGWAEGGDEFNIQNDPLAWQVILDSTVPVTVGDAAVCKAGLSLTSERAHAVLDPAGGSGRFLAGLLDDWLRKNPGVTRQVTGDEKLWPVWDEVTVGYLLGMAKAESRPRPKLRPDLAFDRSGGAGRVMWITSVDGARLWKDLAGKIQSAQGGKGAAAAR